MSIWGKVIGGVAGFALGGPLGALLGGVAGHAVDKMRGSADGEGIGAQAKQVAFTMAIVVLSAKMAKADGQVTRAEVNAFKEIFHVPPHEMSKVGKLFDEAKKEVTGFEPYARQIAMLFKNEPAVLEELLGALIHIAKADGVIHPNEMAFLASVAQIFGYDEAGFERVKARFMAGGPASEDDPYVILGVEPTASDDEIKKTYRRLIRENHPDTLMAQGLPQEFVDLATEKMARINAAYDQIEKARGIA